MEMHQIIYSHEVLSIGVTSIWLHNTFCNLCLLPEIIKNISYI
jgi:hypothetical protein